MMGRDTGKLCLLLAPAMGFLISDSKSLLVHRSPQIPLCVLLPFLTIQGVLLMSLSAEGWRAPAVGDIYGVSFSGDIQNPPGQGPVQPASGDPASAEGLDWMIPRGPFQPLPFCSSCR